MHQKTKDALTWRYAAGKFDLGRKVSSEDLTDILEAGNLMPTSYGLQPFRFVVLEDLATKEKLVEHSWNQRHVADNSHLIVLAVRTDINEAMITEYVTRIETTRGLPSGSVDGYKHMMLGDLPNRSTEGQLVWAQKQAYIALGGMIIAASEKGIDTHALEGFMPEKYDEILGLQDKHLHATVLLAIGYRDPSDEAQHYKKVRVSLEDMVIAM